MMRQKVKKINCVGHFCLVLKLGKGAKIATVNFKMRTFNSSKFKGGKTEHYELKWGKIVHCKPKWDKNNLSVRPS